MTHQISLTLRLLSDWHIGAGTGQHGRLSRQVQRDDDGLPFVPAKTLNGLWRDGCEIAARALDGGGTGVWHDWVEYVFGSERSNPSKEANEPPRRASAPPRPAVLGYEGPLRFPEEFRALLSTADPRLREAVTFVKPGIAHDPRTGAAQDDMLRFDEMARGGVALTGTAYLPAALTGDRLACAFALLWAGARLVEGIGGKRRRGAGRCRLDLTAPGMPQTPEDLERWATNPAEPPAPEAPPEPDGDVRAEAGDGWERVVLRLTLVTPLLAHDRTVGNLVRGRDHAPGWMLLREVLRRLAPAGPAAAAARYGDLVVSAATPAVDGLPGLPVPRVLERGKDDGARHLNRMVQPLPKDEVYKRLRRGYVSGTGALDVRTPGFTLRMHNTVDDATQRPDERHGGVYVYEAIEAGTELAAEIRVRTGVLAPGWHERLNGDWRLGRSRKDDYGFAKAAAEPLDAAPGTAAPLEEGQKLRVWLVSDVLVRNARLAPSDDPDDFARLLTDALNTAGARGLRLTPLPAEPGLVPTGYDTARTDSWHTGWRLPRPVLLGFAAGGCLTFTVAEGRADAAVLTAVERSGIGERRGEGFGQIRLNDPFLSGPAPVAAAAPPPVPRPAPRRLRPGAAGHAEARVIERAAWRAEIWRRAEARAADAGGPLKDLAAWTPTRLNALRRLFDHLDDDPDLLGRRIDALTERWGKDDARRVRALLIDGPPERAVEGAPDGQDAWDQLGFTDRADLCLTKDGHDTLTDELRAEARRTLLTACIAARTRREAHGKEVRS
ncbi:RAMP superfamily CRISPR-associated protein [Actinomadura flavalba]|uniref:RAMP superfamily CRISPR-associated protein n=1 Tax=Actinomadura flavalba TaxID=1120938 RepID=UPI0003697FE4|nr:RAMP superfamily CRISPR-associated protein [Actinomadura flavalba]